MGRIIKATPAETLALSAGARLREQINAAREAADSFIEARVDELRREHPDQPRGALKNMITAHARNCACAAALMLLEKV